MALLFVMMASYVIKRTVIAIFLSGQFFGGEERQDRYGDSFYKALAESNRRGKILKSLAADPPDAHNHRDTLRDQQSNLPRYDLLRIEDLEFPVDVVIFKPGQWNTKIDNQRLLNVLCQKCYIASALEDITVVKPEGKLTKDGIIVYNNNGRKVNMFDKFALLWKGKSGEVQYKFVKTLGNEILELKMPKFPKGNDLILHKVVPESIKLMRERFGSNQIDGCYRLVVMRTEGKLTQVDKIREFCSGSADIVKIEYYPSLIQVGGEYLLVQLPGWLLDREDVDYMGFMGGIRHFAVLYYIDGKPAFGFVRIRLQKEETPEDLGKASIEVAEGFAITEDNLDIIPRVRLHNDGDNIVTVLPDEVEIRSQCEIL